MKANIDLELFYILPYTKSYDCGGYYRSDETCSTAYRPPSVSVWNGSSLLFEDKEELLKWFYNNSGKPIPAVYRIKYIDNYLGVDDVFKITNLKDGKTEYYTALSEDYYAKYDADMSKLYEKNVWVDYYLFRYGENASIRLDNIYAAFSKRGIKIKYDVYKKAIDKKEFFEFIGDPFFEKEEAKGKKLVLYRPSPKGFW